MTKNPLINAITAAVYVAFVSLIPYFGSRIVAPKDTPFGPLAFLSVFTLSAAVMATVFFYQPIVLLMEGHKTEAFSLVLKTIGIFAVITLVFLGIVLATQF